MYTIVVNSNDGSPVKNICNTIIDNITSSKITWMYIKNGNKTLYRFRAEGAGDLWGGAMINCAHPSLKFSDIKIGNYENNTSDPTIDESSEWHGSTWIGLAPYDDPQ